MNQFFNDQKEAIEKVRHTEEYKEFPRKYDFTGHVTCTSMGKRSKCMLQDNLAEILFSK